jgi:YD repeat-containing protein
VTNALGHTAYTQYDYYLGALVNSEDANGIVGSVTYNDVLDRPTQGIQARYKEGVGAPAERRQTTITYDDANRVITTTSDRDTFNDNTLTGKSYYDGFGRTWRGAAYEGPTWSIKDTRFDALGRVSQVSSPYRAADPGSASPPANLWTTTDYDALGRVIRVTTSDGARVDTAYNGNQTTVTDQAGKKRRSETDALGRLVKVTEDPGGMNYDTFYFYDPLGNLRYVGQGGQGRWFSYDLLSRVIRVRNPEQDINYNLPPHTDPLTGGNGWSTAYSYDVNGNLIEKTDARNVKVTYGYDALNRNTTVDYNNTAIAPDVTRVYDNYNPGTNGKGRFWHDYAGGDYYAGLNVEHKAIDGYDALGRPLNVRQHFKLNGSWSAGFTTSQTYDLAGSVKTKTYPSGHTTSYSYNAAGRLISFSGNLGDGVSRNYATITQFNPAGQKERETYGVGVPGMTPLYLNLRYNKRGQLATLRLGSVNDGGSADRGGLDFYYGLIGASYQNPFVDEPNNNGNLVRQWSYVPKQGGGFVTTQLDDYGYDALNRVVTFTEGQINESGVFAPNVATQNFAYDQYGNRRVTSASGGLSNYNPNYNTANNRINGLGCSGSGFSMDSAQPRKAIPLTAVSGSPTDTYSN